jgi:ADP-ribosylglycohydrolase
MPERERFQGCLLGLAAGDAVGTAVEFRPCGAFAPLTDMVGGGPFRLHRGQWTDDTSMGLCLAAGPLESVAFDPPDPLERSCRWASAGHAKEEILAAAELLPSCGPALPPHWLDRLAKRDVICSFADPVVRWSRGDRDA